MTELERQLTAALKRLSAQSETERRRQSEQVEALRRQVERLSAENDTLRRQIERLDEQTTRLVFQRHRHDISDRHPFQPHTPRTPAWSSLHGPGRHVLPGRARPLSVDLFREADQVLIGGGVCSAFQSGAAHLQVERAGCLSHLARGCCAPLRTPSVPRRCRSSGRVGCAAPRTPSPVRPWLSTAPSRSPPA